MSSAAIEAKPVSSGGVDFRRIGLVWTILLIPIETGIALYLPDIRTSGYASTVVFTVFDLPMIVLAAGALPTVVQRIRGRDFSLGAGFMLFLFAAAMVTFPFHPSRSGLSVVIRLGLAAVVAFEVSGLSLRRLRYRVGAPLLIGAAIQSALGLLQVVRGGAIGLGRLGERESFFEFGDAIAAQGTMLHPYVLAGFATLAVTVGVATLPDGGPHRRLWLAGIGVASIPLGVTYSRSGAMGTIAVLGLLVYGAVRYRDRFRAAAIAVAIGALIPAIVFSAGWLDRVDDSARGSIDRSSSGRITLIEQSLDLIESSPVVGVGPGRYAVVMEQDPTVLPQVVHNVPLLIAAESGILAGLVALVMFVLLAWRAFRQSVSAAIVVSGLGVWMVFDKFTYLSPNGLVMFAIWLGVLDWMARGADRDDAESHARDAGVHETATEAG